MGELMHDALGIGLAATQVGVLHRLLVYRVEPDGPLAGAREPRDRVARRGAGDRRGGLPQPAAACTSRSSARSTCACARRTSTASRSWSRPEGLEARVIQHEIDHLDGVLILDRTSREQRKEAMRALREAPRPPPRPPPQCARVFLGTSDFAAAVLRRLADAPHRPALVVTRPDRPRGAGAGCRAAGRRRRRASSASSSTSPRTSTARRRARGSPPPSPRRVVRVRVRRAHQASRCCPSTSSSTCIPRCCRAGAARRPSSARSWPATRETGVSIMRLTAGLDSGRCASSEAEPIAPEDDYGSLAARLEDARRELLVRGARRAPAVRRAGRGRRHLRREDHGRRPHARSGATRGRARARRCARCTRTSARASRCRTARSSASRAARVGERAGALELLEVQPRGRTADALRRLPARARGGSARARIRRRARRGAVAPRRGGARRRRARARGRRLRRPCAARRRGRARRARPRVRQAPGVRDRAAARDARLDPRPAGGRQEARPRRARRAAPRPGAAAVPRRGRRARRGDRVGRARQAGPRRIAWSTPCCAAAQREGVELPADETPEGAAIRHAHPEWVVAAVVGLARRPSARARCSSPTTSPPSSPCA